MRNVTPLILVKTGVPLPHAVHFQSPTRVWMIIWVRIPDTRRVPDLMRLGTGMIFYSWVSHIPDLNRDGYEVNIFSTRG
jgi:hypothetical protein